MAQVTLLDGDTALPPKGAQPPQFSAHVRCGQTAGWIKMPLGMEVGLSPGDFVRQTPSSPHERGTAAPLFLAHVYCGHGHPFQLLLSCCFTLTTCIT